MGFNSTLVILHDALTDIRNDKAFGAKVHDAVAESFIKSKPVDIAAGCFPTAAIAVESHHSNILVPVLVGANTAYVIHTSGVAWNAENHELDLLKQLAEKHGFSLRRKSEPQSKKESL